MVWSSLVQARRQTSPVATSMMVLIPSRFCDISVTLLQPHLARCSHRWRHIASRSHVSSRDASGSTTAESCSRRQCMSAVRGCSCSNSFPGCHVTHPSHRQSHCIQWAPLDSFCRKTAGHCAAAFKSIPAASAQRRQTAGCAASAPTTRCRGSDLRGNQ